MKKTAILLTLIMSAALCRAQEITGTWSGKADLGAMSLRLVFHIEKQDEGYCATMDSPDQGAVGIPVTGVSFSRDTLKLEVAPIKFVYTGVLKGDGIEGSFAQGGATFPLDLSRSEAAAESAAAVVLNRPQEPRPPFPYRTEDVVFENAGAGIELAGTLTIPSGEGKFPAVVLLTGSGPQNRDEELFGHKPFLVLADYLTRRGIAVLRFDDRGVGESQGSQLDATSADFATDALAALEYLRSREEINHTKTGLAGHSEGALIAFIAAAGNPSEVAFVVSMAGPGVDGEEILAMQVRDIAVSYGTPDDALGMVAEQNRFLTLICGNTPEYVEANIDAIAEEIMPGFSASDEYGKDILRAQIRSTNAPWFRFFLKYDPAADLERVKCPVLAINGGKDLQVRSSVNLAAIRTALEKGGNKSVEVVEYPGLNHLFQTAGTGLPTEYGQIEETFSPAVMEDIAAWISKR